MKPIAVRVLAADLRLQALNTRLPFRYGIATLTAVPHLLVRLDCEIEGYSQAGFAADSLIPKWFTKDPHQSYPDELEAMLAVIQQACDLAAAMGSAGGGTPSAFDLWQQLYARQAAWAAAAGHPSLLAGFGVSLVERAVIDACCRQSGLTFDQALRRGALGLRLDDLHPELADLDPEALLPAAPARRLSIRHTIGLSDPLTEADLAPGEDPGDGLPASLEASVLRYGLRYFKIKLNGNPQTDLPRLEQIAAILAQSAPGYRYSLDGNEQFDSVEAFRAFWEQLEAATPLAAFRERLLYVEQPVRRQNALDEPAARALWNWPARPPLIIDESDGEPGSLRRALQAGYHGGSHKNCKGVFKGLANGCYLSWLRRGDPAGRYILTGEDLVNLGPVALLQDLAVLATLGLEQAERNGHHYFAGLAGFPSRIQAHMLAAHPDLYTDELGFASLNIQDGAIHLESVLAAPFGVGFTPEHDLFAPVNAWRNQRWQATQPGTA